MGSLAQNTPYKIIDKQTKHLPPKSLRHRNLRSTTITPYKIVTKQTKLQKDKTFYKRLGEDWVQCDNCDKWQHMDCADFNAEQEVCNDRGAS